MRNSVLRSVSIALFFSVAACTAAGSDDQSHGPVFGPNDAGVDGAKGEVGGIPPEDGASPPPDGAALDTNPPPPPNDSGADAGSDAGGCTDKTAVLAASATTLYTSVAVGAGAWTTTNVTGTFHGGTTLVPFGTGFHGVVVGAGNAIQWLAWTGASWTAPLPIGGAATTFAPALTTLNGTEVHLVYADAGKKYFHGTFKAGAWDAATDPVGGAAAQSFGPTGVGLAAIGGALLMAHAGGNNTNLFAEGLAAGSGVPVATAQTEALMPALIASPVTGSDAMIVYVHLVDFKISWATRAGATWTDHGKMDDTLFTGAGIWVAAATLAGGKAVIVFQGSNGKAYATTFDGAKWVVPATNLDPGTLGGLPAVAPGACGDDAVVALPMTGGAVKTARLTGGTWSPAVDVTGTAASNVVAIATTK
jgi:hypothetical protein